MREDEELLSAPKAVPTTSPPPGLYLICAFLVGLLDFFGLLDFVH